MDEALERLEALKRGYAGRLPERVHAVHALAAQLAGRWDRAAAEDLRRLLHNLAGSGGAYGFYDVSTTARAAEQTLVEVLDAGDAPDVDSHAALQNAVDALVAAGTAAAGGTLIAPTAERRRRIEVLGLDGDGAHREVELLRALGETAFPAGAESSADARVLVLGESRADMLAALAALAGTGAPPTCAILHDDDFEFRLAALRAGASAVLHRPLDPEELIETLDALTGHNPDQPYRVLLVDDHEDEALLCRRSLAAAGMQVEIAGNARVALAAVEAFDPDAVLLDLGLPDCGGAELAGVLRQARRWAHLPIVYLSGEIRPAQQLAALRAGGDDFLVKPVDAATLARVAGLHAARGRAVRELALRDGLTGLYNHSATLAQLEREAASATRTGRELAVAMLDLDRFKQINDAFGHSMGDRVLKALARLVQLRLRASDFVGRVGGEEFMLIMPDTGVAAAHAVVDELRAQFGRQPHQLASRTLFASFSAGVAGARGPLSGATLARAADRALYRAKRGGRDRALAATAAEFAD